VKRIYTCNKEEITNYNEQNLSWKPNSHSASQEIPRLFWKLKVHYRVHNRSPLTPILSQMHSVHNFPPHFPKIHSDILQSMPTPSAWIFPSSFTTEIFLF